MPQKRSSRITPGAPKSRIAAARTYDDDATRNQDLLVGRIDAILNGRLIVPNLLKQYGGKLAAALIYWLLSTVLAIVQERLEARANRYVSGA